MTSVFQDSSFISTGDGLSTTLLISESIIGDNQWHGGDNEWRSGMVFWPPLRSGLPPKPDVHTINSQGVSANRLDMARPSSFHLGGVNAAFCDGAAKFISQDMDYRIYCALMTPKGKFAMEPGSTVPSLTVQQQPPLTYDSF